MQPPVAWRATTTSQRTPQPVDARRGCQTEPVASDRPAHPQGPITLVKAPAEAAVSLRLDSHQHHAEETPTGTKTPQVHRGSGAASLPVSSLTLGETMSQDEQKSVETNDVAHTTVDRVKHSISQLPQASARLKPFVDEVNGGARRFFTNYWPLMLTIAAMVIVVKVLF